MKAITSRESALALRVAARATLRYLESSSGWEKLAQVEGVFHSGDAPIRADQEAHRVFDRTVRTSSENLGDSIYAVVGEELIQPLPHSYEPGVRLIVVDPLDGSTQWSLIHSVFCVAAYCLVADQNGELKMESAVVANPQHCFTWLANKTGFEVGLTRQDGESDWNTLDVIPEGTMSAPSIAFTGFKPKDRKALLDIAETLADWHILTLGGNPVTPYVVTGGLTAAVTLRPQAAWDALGILMASRSNAVVGALDGTILDPPTFESLFTRVVLEGNVRRIPALVVAKSEARYHEIVESLSPHVSDDLHLSGPMPIPPILPK